MNDTDFRKCVFDFPFFAQNYLRIIHPRRGLVPFEIYPYQERVIDAYTKHRFNILKKFRQGGFTTTTLLWLLWKCMFQPDQRVLFVSKYDRESRYASKIISDAIRNLPDWLKPVLGKDNTHEKEFLDTESHIIFTTCQAAKSRAVTHLVIDEPAFMPKMDEHWKCFYPVISTGGKCIILSTPNGRGNWFEKTYTEAKEGKNEFNVVDVNFWEHPDYQNPQYVEELRNNLGLAGWSQEVLAAFD